MKKLIAIVLCLVMALSIAAFAETAEKTVIGSVEVNGAFTLQATLPEGYTINQLYADDFGAIWFITNEDSTKPILTLAIAFDEGYADIARFNDLDEEALNDLIATYDEYEVEISYVETAYGTKVMQIVEVGDYADFVDFFTIYNGYCVEIVITAGTDADETLTQEQIQMCIDFLSEMDFIAIEAE